MERLEVSGAVRPIYGSLGVKRLTSAPGGGEWSTSLPDRFTPREWKLVPFEYEAERGPRAGLDVSEKVKVSSPGRE